MGHSGGTDSDGNELPRLVYVSREKRPGFNHHKKAGAMNALVCILFRSPYKEKFDNGMALPVFHLICMFCFSR